MDNIKVAIHQPNYLPWIGYFDKLDQVDKFVILDKAIHSKSSFVNRNKIKTPQGSIWLTVPLKNKEKPIRELIIANETNWKEKHWKVIESNYKKCEFWNDYKDGLEKIYYKDWEKLIDLNLTLIHYVKKALGIQTEIVVESDFQQDFGRGNIRNLNLVKHLGGTIYVSGTGAQAYNNKKEFQEHHIELVYQKLNHPVYKQQWGEFFPNLSMIDMLFNCGPNTLELIRKRRDEHPSKNNLEGE